MTLILIGCLAICLILQHYIMSILNKNKKLWTKWHTDNKYIHSACAKHSKWIIKPNWNGLYTRSQKIFKALTHLHSIHNKNNRKKFCCNIIINALQMNRIISGNKWTVFQLYNSFNVFENDITIPVRLFSVSPWHRSIK